MTRGQFTAILQHLRGWLSAQPGSSSDGECLRRFARDRDETAFETLVQRHAAMVLGVCRRVLREPHACEDAFQATFFVLARKAASVIKHESIGSWLHGVALRVAVRSKTTAARRQAIEKRESDMSQQPVEPAGREALPDRELDRHEAAALLDEEIQGLPEKLRAPLILCCLEGKTHEEAARALNCPGGSMSWRIEQAKEKLRQRLVRRGYELPAIAMAALLTQNQSQAAAPALLTATVRQALLFSAGAQAPASPSDLAEGVLRTMFLSKMRNVGLGLAALLLVGIGLSAALGGADAVVPDAAGSLLAVVPDDPKEKEKLPAGKTEPAGVPLELKLIARSKVYALIDKLPVESPPPLKVDLALELRNTGDKELTVYYIGGDGPFANTGLWFLIKGPEVEEVPFTFPGRVNFGSTSVKLPAGKSHTVPIQNLQGLHHRSYTRYFWKKPGEYTLQLRGRVAIAPAPEGVLDVQNGFGLVQISSNAIRVEVAKP